MQRLKKIINYAMKHEYILTNPMAKYTLQFKQVNKIALTMEEVRAMANLDLKRDTLRHVLNVFLFQCYTGLSYSDVKKITPSEIVSNTDGKWIKMERTKTGNYFSVPVLPLAQKILDDYPASDSTLPIFPVLSNQKMNDNLKIIQELAAISKNLTTHLARHTFATTITLSNGVPLETVSRMLGHTKLSTTQMYAKVLDSKISKDMEGLVDKFR